MIEVEVKARVDHDRAQYILCLLGIPQVSMKVMTDTYYDTPALNLYGRGESLRIRQSCRRAWHRMFVRYGSAD